MAKVECPDCGQWIEKRGLKMHRGSKKCIEAQGKENVSRETKENEVTVCPNCESDLELLTTSTVIKRSDGQYVPKEEIQKALDKGYTKYCDRCLEVYK